jgi:alpha-beta hydrolase superfamily lysophospholipase
LAGRTWSLWELALRDVRTLAEYIDTPLFIEHGDQDPRVPHSTHCIPLHEKLEALGKEHRVEYLEGADHALEPVTTRLDSFKEHAPDPLRMYQREHGGDDFAQGRSVRIPAADRTVTINWDQPADSSKLFRIQ